MARRALLLAGVAVVTILAACASGRNGVPSSDQLTLLHDGAIRRYVVRAPPEPALRGARVPLVIVLHGGGGNAANAERMTGFTAKAREEGFIVVYPEGTSRRAGRLLTWNAGHCCGYAMNNGVDDVGFINALIDRLTDDYPIDTSRIHATGMSNGGMMAHRLGIELSGRLAAIAPVVATVFGDEPMPQNPVSAIIVNGMLDESVPHEGGPPGGRFTGAWDGTPAKPALAQAAFWASANDCRSTPERRDDGASVVTRYICPPGRNVEIHLVRDNGHAWPGGQRGSRLGDEPSATFNATDAIWEFFEAHSR